MTRYIITSPDYKKAFKMIDLTKDGIVETDKWWWECCHCMCYTGSEKGMIRHLEERHWWLHHPERVILP